MKNTHFATVALLAFGLILILDGCLQPEPWHLRARKEGDTVQLCISQKLECPQPGIGTDSISVYRYDSLLSNQLVWEAASETESTFDGMVTYGIPPKNWHNKLTPPALVCGKSYLVNPGALFFALKCDGTVVVF